MLFHRLLQKILRWVACGVFYFTIYSSLNPWMIFPFQNVIANLCVFVTGVCVCVHPHSLNKDFSQAVIGTFYQYHFQKIVGWVAFKFLFFMLKFKLFKMCRPLSLFILLRFLLSVWKVIPYRKGMSCGMCSLKITTSKGILYSLGQLERLYDAISDKDKTSDGIRREVQ